MDVARRSMCKMLTGLFGVHTLAHVLLLFHRATMWDGWIWMWLFDRDAYDRFAWIFSQSRLLHTYQLYRWLDSVGNIIALSDIITFFSWFVAGAALYVILRLYVGLVNSDSFFLAAIFLTAPIFLVRFEYAVLFYSISLASFHVAVLLFFGARSRLSRHSIVLYIFSAFLFCIAFLTNSLLVYYFGFILFIFYADVCGANRCYVSVLSWCRSHVFWILLPFLFYGIYQLPVGFPRGLYAGYNTFVFSFSDVSLFDIVWKMLGSYWQFVGHGLFGPVGMAVGMLNRRIMFVLAITIFFLIRGANRAFSFFGSSPEKRGEFDRFGYLFWGIVFFFFAALSYVLVDESPTPYGGFGLRNGLLLGFPFGLLFLWFLLFFVKRRFVVLVQTFTLAVFITFHFFNYSMASMDGFLQQATILSLQQSAEQFGLRDDAVVVFHNELLGYWFGREPTSPEYTGYIYRATGKPQQVGAAIGRDVGYSLTINNDMSRYEELRPRIVHARVYSGRAYNGFEFFSWIRLMYARIVDAHTFERLVSEYFDVHVVFSYDSPSSWNGDYVFVSSYESY